MENFVEFNKEGLIKELKELHKKLVEVYTSLFVDKYSNDISFKEFVDQEYQENGVIEEDKKDWNEKFCHKASYTLINKILFIKICEDKEFMISDEDRFITGEVKNANVGKKLSNIGYQKWTNLVTNYTLNELLQLAFRDMSISYPNIMLYKHDKYERLNPNKEKLEKKFVLSENQYSETYEYKFESVLTDIIQSLDKPEYHFGLDVKGNILGDVYEKFLDRDTRKALGQFYTPDFVIDYILKNTVQNADVVENPFVKVIDISCGSGHFLISAYNILRSKFEQNIDLLNKKYAEADYDICKNGKVQTVKGFMYWIKENIHYHLLKHCIFGADIDDFAVQLTTINLLLMDLNNITDELNIIQCDSLEKYEQDYDWEDLKEQLNQEYITKVHSIKDFFGNEKIIEESVIRDKYRIKHKNIVNIFDERELDRKDAEELLKKCEMWSQRFDYVVGNPPYVRQEKIGNKGYLEKNYKVYNSIADLLTYFIERCTDIAGANKRIGLIVSDKFTRTNYGRKIRNFIKHETSILVYKDKFESERIIFDDATVDTSILVLEKNKLSNGHKFLYNENQLLLQENLNENGWYFSGGTDLIIKNKMESVGTQISQIKDIKINRGILTGFNKAFIINRKTAMKLIEEDDKNEDIIVKILRGRDIDQYSIDFHDQYLINTQYDLNVEEEYPSVYNFMLKYKNELSKRLDQGKHWYNLRACTYYDDFEKEKIIFANMAIQNRFYYDEEKYYINQKAFVLTSESVNLKYLSGVLNSSLLFFYFRMITPKLMGETREYSKVFVDRTPICFNKEIEARIIECVDVLRIKLDDLKSFRIIDYIEHLRGKVKLELRKARSKVYIDQVMYKTYGLDAEEIIYVEKDINKYISLEKQNYFESIKEGNNIIQDIFLNVDQYIKNLSAKIPPDVFIEKHVIENMSLEKIAEEFGFEVITVALLREFYASNFGGNEPWKFYNLSDLYKSINQELKNIAIDIIYGIGKYVGLDRISELLNKNYGNINELVNIMRINDPSKKIISILKDAINTDADTWSSYIKNRNDGKEGNSIVKYDNGVYGLSDWEDEIHKEYFLETINEYTISKPNKKKAENILKIIKQLDIEDKEAYVDEIEKTIKKIFS